MNKENTNSILRLGETVESLFCLPPNTNSKIKTLCQKLAANYDDDSNNNNSAVQPSDWYKALQYSTKCNLNIVGGPRKDLIRLHRRATTVLQKRYSSASASISIDQEVLSSKSNFQAQSLEKEYYFRIWLAYADIQKKCQDLDGARRTFRHIKVDKIHYCSSMKNNVEGGEENYPPCVYEYEPSAQYYLALANFEEKHGM